MNTRCIKIIDQRRQVVAMAQVAERGDRFAGQIDLDLMPARLRQQFEEYEEIVNGQEFGLLDEIEDQIDALALKAVFEDGSEVAVVGFQAYPSTRRVSFQIAKERAQKVTST